MNKTLMILGLFMASILCFGDSISGTYKGPLVISVEGESRIELTLEELFSVALEGDTTFIEGFELEIQIPQAFTRYRDSFALFLYDGISPDPGSGTRRYSGRELGFLVLPPGRRFYTQYVLKDRSPRGDDPDITVFKTEIDPQRLPIMGTILPVMKGIPNSFYRETFTIIGKPMVSDTGALSIRLSNDLPVTVLINGEERPNPTEPIILEPGIHRVETISAYYEPLSLQVGIEQGKSTEVLLDLKKKVPRISFEAPETASVYLNGEKIQDTSKIREVSAGEHVVVMSLGEYSLTRSINVEAGHVYHVQLFMDIVIKVD